MSQIIIRPATKDDAFVIAEISRQTFYDSFIADNTEADMQLFLDKQFATKDLVDEVGAPGNYFFLAYLNNELAGYVRMREGIAHTAFQGKLPIEIARLYAIKTMIGKGIGKALMEHCIAFAKQLQREIIWLGVWEKNYRAIAFYQKFGFKKFGQHDFLLGNDLQTDWEMIKEL